MHVRGHLCMTVCMSVCVRVWVHLRFCTYVFGQEDMHAYTHAFAQAAQKALIFQEAVEIKGESPKPQIQKNAIISQCRAGKTYEYAYGTPVG